jgi:hypothetical protein
VIVHGQEVIRIISAHKATASEPCRISKYGRKSGARKRLECLAVRPKPEIDLSETLEMAGKRLFRMVPSRSILTGTR